MLDFRSGPISRQVTMSQLELEAQPQSRPLWPAAVILLGLGLTLIWTLLLGYGLVRIVEAVI